MSDGKKRVAVVGAGPAGFFSVAELLKHSDVEIDVFEKRAVPHGLVRFGVAPDHPKIKAVSKKFDKSLFDERVRFFGNVEFGKDLTLEEARENYDAVILSIGAPYDFQLGIEGEDLSGVIAAREFVGWFNCDPELADLSVDLSAKEAVVIGIGNVAMDVARVLLRPVDELAKTDIADHALKALRESSVTDVHVVARRGPAQAACTFPELKEITNLNGVQTIIHGDAFSGISDEMLEDKDAKKMVTLLREVAENEQAPADRRLHFHFLTSPLKLSGGDSRLEKVSFVRNRLQVEDGYAQAVPVEGSEFELSAQMLLRAIRYKGEPFTGLPFNEKKGVIPNDAGRVDGVPGVYVSGWIKRGASGVIGTNKPDAAETVASVLQDLEGREASSERPRDLVNSILTERDVRIVNKDEWGRIGAEEKRRGEESGRDGVRFVHLEDIINFLEC